MKSQEFWIAQKRNAGGKLWGRRYDEDKFQYSRPGDMLMLPFQCEWCWFINLKRQLPVPGAGSDEKLLEYIRRANLDAMWAKEPSTVDGVLRQERKAARLRAELGLESPNYPERGPWPVEDTVGMTTCLTILAASTKPGSYHKTHQQYDTIRKLRSVYTSIYQSSVWAEEHSLVFSGEKGRKYRTAHGETESFFYKVFNLGLEKRMDKDVRSNIGLEFGILLQMLDNVEGEMFARGTDRDRKRFLVMFGSFLAIGYAGSLRGNEGLFVEAKATVRNIMEGMYHPEYPHVCVYLFGRFKGETNEAVSTLVLANKSRSGLLIRKWVERLVGILVVEGAMEREGDYVPAICNKDGTLMDSQKMNKELWTQLERIQKENVGMIDKDLKIRKRFGISRSLRRGSRTRAQYMRVDKDIVDLVNRWNKFEVGKGKPALSMFDHYAEMKQLLNIFAIYSEAL